MYVVDVLTEDAMTRFGMSEERARKWAERDWENIVAENSSREEFEVYRTLSQRADRTVDVLFNGGGKASLKVVGVDRVYDGWRVHLHAGSDKTYTYEFAEGQSRSKQTSNGKFVEIPMMGTVNALRYGSDVNGVQEDQVYEKQELDLVNNLENASKLFDNLASIDDTVSNSHNARLKRVLRKIVDDLNKFIPGMQVAINRNADRNYGRMIEGTGIQLGVSNRVRAVANMMSAQEAYVHELIHSATVFALRAGGETVDRVVRRLQQLRRQLREEITVEDLMPSQSVDPVYERKIAQDAFDYIFNNEKTGLEEFISYGLSNEAIAKKLESLLVNKPIENEPENMFEAVVHWLRKIVNAATVKLRHETNTTTGYELLMKLTMELAHANNKAMQVTSESNVLSKFGTVSEKLNSELSRIMKEFLGRMDTNEYMPPLPVAGATKADWIKYLWKAGPRMLGDKKARPAWKELMKALGMSYVGDIQTAFMHFSTADTLQRGIEKLGMLSENIDKARETRARISADQIRKSFKSLSDQEKNALTLGVLDIDLGSVYGKFENLVTMLRDSKVLNETIKEHRDRIRQLTNRDEYNYLMYQAEGLGHYMATHKATTVQRFNAQSIVQNLSNMADSTELIMLVDELATMYGMAYTHQDTKNVVADLMEREPDGMDFTIKLHKATISMARDTIFASSANLMIKGYTKEIFDSDITMQVAPSNDKARMKKEGFTWVKDLKKAANDTSTTQMAMYISKNHAQQNYKKSAMRLTDLNRKGMTLTDVRNITNEELAREYAKRDIAKIKTDSARLLSEVMKGTKVFNAKDTGGLIPLYNNDGTVVNYRYMMDKRSKRELLGQDIKGHTVLGRMQAVIEDKMDTEEHNNKVFGIIQNDMIANYRPGSSIGRNGYRYIVIKAGSSDKEIQEIYKLIPKDIKERITELPGEEMAVRADMVRFYFGMREASTFDLIEKIPLIGPDIVKYTPGEIKMMVQYAEMIWSAVVSIAKVDIVIRTPMVLIGNIVSNIMYSVQSGYLPLRVLRMQLDAFKGLKEYIDMTHEVVRMENLKAVGKLAQKDWDKLTSLKEDMRKHPAHELIDEGMFQAIIEDVGSDEFKSSNKVTKYLDKKLENAPQYVKDGANWLYLTERTEFFRMMSMATQFSDFAARQVQHSLNKERLFKQIEEKAVNGKLEVKDLPWLLNDDMVKGMPYITKEAAKRAAVRYSREQVLDAFVNYSKPEGKVVDWMNRMGLVMFTKYFMRIQRAIGKNFIDNPLYAMMSLLGQHFIVDVDSIDDQLLMFKDTKYLFKNPLDHLERLIMPTGLEFALNPIP